MKRLSFLFAFILVCSCLIAQTAIAPAVGDGSENDPYEIASLENLYWIAASNDVVPDPDQTVRWSSHYVQTANIDASETISWFGGQGWTPIGYRINTTDNLPFIGSYDGQDNTIDALFINRPNTSSIGLFGYTDSSLIENIGACNIDITGYSSVGSLVGRQLNGSIITNSYSTGSVSGSDFVGALVGIQEYSTISSSYSTGYVTGTGIWGSVGGLVGFQEYSTINNCYSTAGVNGDFSVGGLVGSQALSSTVSNSYSKGTVSGDLWIGGLVGNNSYSSGISNCFSTGNVSGGGKVGGLVGEQIDSTISNCFSTGSVNGYYNFGGLVGEQDYSSIVNSSYWNIETSGQTTSYGGEGRTTAEMTYPYATNTYVDWDFEEIWLEDESYEGNDGYPYLCWQEILLSPIYSHSPVPENGAVNIPVDTPIGWTYTSTEGFADPHGFLINMWSSDMNSEPYQAEVEGGAGEYLFEQHPFEFDYEEDYYWQVVPYVVFNNEHIYAEDCPIWTFTTDIDTSVDETDNPCVTQLKGNYPNPFNPETTISYSLQRDVEILSLNIYNIRGQLVRELITNIPHQQGEYQIVWDGKNDLGQTVPSGVYFYRMTTQDFDQVNKMLLLK